MLAPGLDADIVARVVSAMLGGQWLTGASRRALAAETGLSLPEVGRHVEAALVTVQGAMGPDVAEMAHASVARLERWAEQASRGVSPAEAATLGCFPVAPDLKTAGALLRTANEIAGTIRPTQVLNLIDASGAPKGVLAEMGEALARVASAYPEAAGALQEAVRSVGGPALRPATATIAAQLEQHAVVESYPEWLLQVREDSDERNALEVLWCTMPLHSAESTRAEVCEWGDEVVRRARG